MSQTQRKKSRVGRILLIIGGVLLSLLLIVGGLAYWLYADKMQSIITNATNEYIQGLIARDAMSTGKKVGVELGLVNYSFFGRTLEVKDVHITMGVREDTADTYMDIRIPRVYCTGINPWDVLFGDGLSLGDVVISEPSLFRRPGSGETDSLKAALDKTGEKLEASKGQDKPVRDSAFVKLPRLPDVDSLIGSLLGAILPDNIKPLWLNSITVQEGIYVLSDKQHGQNTGGAMVGVNMQFNGLSIRDTTETYRAVMESYLSVRQWTRPFEDGDTVKVYGGRIVVDKKDSSMYVDSVEYLVPNATRTHASGIHISFRDRTLALDTFSFAPTITDAQVFAKSKYRTDRARVSASKVVLRDIDTKGLINGTALHAHTLDVSDFYIDVLTNSRGLKNTKEKSLMPYQMAAGIPFKLGLDSVRIGSTTIVYGELHKNSNQPAILAFERIRFLVTDVSNDPEVQKVRPMKIYGKGAFQKNGLMDIVITMPLNVSENTMDVEASLNGMDLRTFNSFLPIAENIKVKNGWVKLSTVKLKVRGRKSTGVVSPQYIDFELEVLNSKTKKAGFWEGIASFLANWVKIKNENVPGPEFQQGRIAYTIPESASFFQALWFPIRSGLGQVIGF